MVRGQRIDEAGIARALDGVGLVICHNARFDRAFLEARYPAFANRHFACSLEEVPWDLWNMRSSKLDYLGFRFGLFHEGHRARADVDMLLALLAQKAPDGEQDILSCSSLPPVHLPGACTPSACRSRTRTTPSARGYRWNDGKFNTIRAWWIETRDEKAEREFLAGVGCKSPMVVRQTALERYRSLAARVETQRPPARRSARRCNARPSALSFGHGAGRSDPDVHGP